MAQDPRAQGAKRWILIDGYRRARDAWTRDPHALVPVRALRGPSTPGQRATLAWELNATSWGWGEHGRASALANAEDAGVAPPITQEPLRRSRLQHALSRVSSTLRGAYRRADAAERGQSSRERPAKGIETRLTRAHLEAFAALPDHERQDSLWNAYRAQGYLPAPERIRKALCAGALDASAPAARLASARGYAQRGGRRERDPFTTTVWLTDAELARATAHRALERSARACARREGWGTYYVSLTDAHPATLGLAYVEPEHLNPAEPEHGARERALEVEKFAACGVLERRALDRSLRQLRARRARWSPRTRAASAVLAYPDREGNVALERGLRALAHASAPTPPPPSTAPRTPAPHLSPHAEQILREVRQIVVGEHLSRHPALARDALLFTLARILSGTETANERLLSLDCERGPRGTLSLRDGRTLAPHDLRGSESETFRRLRAMDDEAKGDLLARCTALLVVPRLAHESLPDSALEQLVGTLDIDWPGAWRADDPRFFSALGRDAALSLATPMLGAERLGTLVQLDDPTLYQALAAAFGHPESAASVPAATRGALTRWTPPGLAPQSGA